MKKTLRTYFRPEARCSLKQQEAACRSYDGKIIPYVEGERSADDPFPNRDAWVNAMRPGELFAVPFFHRLATTAEGLREVREAIRLKKAIIVELATGRRTDDPDHNADMLDEARNWYSQRGMSKRWASKIGKIGAANSSASQRIDGRAPFEKVEAILNNHKKYPTLALALDAANALKDDDSKLYPTKWNAAFVYKSVERGDLTLNDRTPGPKFGRGK
jgi:hypothetical protein